MVAPISNPKKVVSTREMEGLRAGNEAMRDELVKMKM
jgi:hypothetical protein